MFLIRFLGSVYFAIILIALTAFFVICGTLIESMTSSHLYASKFTYGNPFFIALLFGFFINIFVATIRRWPFKWKKVPFLITHLGLLMVILGVILKLTFGIQGSMIIREGSGSQSILIPNTEAIYLENLTDNIQTIPLSKIKVLKYFPHVKEQYKTWIKNGIGFFYGGPPFLIQNWKKESPITSSASWMGLRLVGLKTDEMEKAIDDAYAQVTEIEIGGERIKLEKALQDKIVTLSLHEKIPFLEYKNKLRIPLFGEHALYNEKLSPHFFTPLIELISEPTLLFIEDSSGFIHLTGWDQNGVFWKEKFDPTKLTSLFSYDNGYQGYTVKANLFQSLSRYEAEELQLKALAQELVHLNLPFQLQERQWVDFFQEWKKEGGWLFWKQQSYGINWDSKKKGALLCAILFQNLEAGLKDGKSLYTLLNEQNWPLIHLMYEQEFDLTLFTKQLFSLADFLPIPKEFEFSDATLLSAYCRLYGLHLDQLPPFMQTYKETTIECPLSMTYIPENPLLKIEDNKPAVTFQLDDDFITLAYDSHAIGLKWPAIHGKYLTRFQPLTQELPYRVRLHQARQITYPHDTQAVGYEADVMIQPLSHDEKLEATLSMNHVYETWDGYRFYLSSISPKDAGLVHQVQLIVNYDPAKYLFTYPGACILALGIILLFWIHPYKRKNI